MAERRRWFLVAASVAVVASLAGSARAGDTARAADTAPSGTWTGRSGIIGYTDPPGRLAQLTLTTAAAGARLVATGPTGASHDAPSARATCTSSYVAEGTRAGWWYYRQRPGGTVRGEGGIETAPCSTRPELVMRIRRAGAKLKVEIGTRSRGGSESFLYRAYVARR
jgi:hypothetical protein